MNKFIILILALFPFISQAAVPNVEDLWIREPLGKRKMSALYFTVSDLDNEFESIESVKTIIADKVSIHRTINDKGISKMIPVDRLALPATDKVILTPGGLHIMLEQINQDIKAGQLVPVTISFRRHGSGEVVTKEYTAKVIR